jgi:hypothetical protein
MAIERLPAVGSDGDAHIIIKRTASFPAAGRQQWGGMASYRLLNGDELTPTSTPKTFRTLDGDLEVRLVA